jgi:hypothetical protein
MKALYRTAAVVLTLIAALVAALLINVATDSSKEIRVVNFTLFAVGTVVVLLLAMVLWRRAGSK